MALGSSEGRVFFFAVPCNFWEPRREEKEEDPRGGESSFLFVRERILENLKNTKSYEQDFIWDALGAGGRSHEWRLCGCPARNASAADSGDGVVGFAKSQGIRGSVRSGIREEASRFVEAGLVPD